MEVIESTLCGSAREARARRACAKEDARGNAGGYRSDYFDRTEAQGVGFCGGSVGRYPQFVGSGSSDLNYKPGMENERRLSPSVVAGMASATNLEIGKGLDPATGMV